MAENRTLTSIAAQAVCDKLPLPAYGFHFNPAMPMTIPKPMVPWIWIVGIQAAMAEMAEQRRVKNAILSRMFPVDNSVDKG